jgi:hypothetical protein
MRVPMADFAGRDERRREPRGESTILRVMRTNADGSVACAEETRFASFESALREAEKAQRAFDEACEPKRCYLCDSSGVPLRAAGAARR